MDVQPSLLVLTQDTNLSLLDESPVFAPSNNPTILQMWTFLLFNGSFEALGVREVSCILKNGLKEFKVPLKSEARVRGRVTAVTSASSLSLVYNTQFPSKQINIKISRSSNILSSLDVHSDSDTSDTFSQIQLISAESSGGRAVDRRGRQQLTTTQTMMKIMKTR